MKKCILACLLLCWALLVVGCGKEKTDNNANTGPPPTVKTEQTKTKEGADQTKSTIQD